MKLIVRVSIALAIFYCLISGGVYLFQEKIIFPATKLPVGYKYSFPVPFKEVAIPVKDAVLSGLIFEPKGESKGVVIYFHGQGGSIDSWGRIEKDFTGRGYTLFLVDYRGYGKSTGYISNEKQLFDDAQKVYDFASTQFPNSVKIIWGRSIGSGIAAELASHNQAHVLVLETPYYNLREMAAKQKPYLPVRWLLKYPIMSNEYVAKVDYPIFIIHGTADNVIPYSSAKKLAAVVPAAKFTTVPDAGHDVTESTQYQQFLDEVLR